MQTKNNILKYFLFITGNSPLVSQSSPPLERGLHTPWQWDVVQTGAKVCRKDKDDELIISISTFF